MGLFYIYSNKTPNELYNSITFTQPKMIYIDPDDIYDLEKISVEYKTYIVNDFWQNLICIELLPNHIILHTGVFFQGRVEMEWEYAWEWLHEKGYDRVRNMILSEGYFTISDAVDGVNYFCDMVAKTKVTQFLLMGYYNEK